MLTASLSGRLLHVGCGGDPLPEWAEGYAETRLDIDPRHSPDIVASMTNLGEIGTYDAILCAHALEHLSFPEVAVALKEFFRVLNPFGKVFIIVPDLEGIQPTFETVYTAPCGPVCGFDMYYGHHQMTGTNPYMAHRSGFIAATLKAQLEAAGFQAATRRSEFFNLIGVGVKA